MSKMTTRRTRDKVLAHYVCQLTTNVRPKHYSLSIFPQPKRLECECEATVTIEVKKECRSIAFHGSDLNIRTIELRQGAVLIKGGKLIPSQRDDLVELVFSKPCSIGMYTLKFEYTARIYKDTRGVCTFELEGRNGKFDFIYANVWMRSARRIYPCWDETLVFCTYDLKVTLSEDMTCFGPTAVKNIKPIGRKLVEVSFKTTPPLPTNAVGFAIGKFDYLEETTEQKICVKVHSLAGKKAYVQFVLDVVVGSLNFYTNYLDFELPKEKIDIITISYSEPYPLDMWGLCLFPDTILMSPHEMKMAAGEKQRLAQDLCYSVSHFWFKCILGVTRWERTWVCQGLCMFMHYLCVDHLFPTFAIYQDFIINCYLGTLKVDCLQHALPIRKKTAVSYDDTDVDWTIKERKKCAAVLRMVQCYVGADDFKKGMQQTVRKHKHTGILIDEVWICCEQISKRPVTNEIDNWIVCPGYPLVTVSIKTEKDKNILSLRQDRFMMYEKRGNDEDEETIWGIPIHVTTLARFGRELLGTLMTTKEITVLLPNVGSISSIYTNPGAMTLARTKYPAGTIEKIYVGISNRSFPGTDLIAILDDMHAFALAGIGSIKDIFHALYVLRADTDTPVWMVALLILSEYVIAFYYTDVKIAILKFQTALIQKCTSRLSWEPKPKDTHFEAILRPFTFKYLVMCNDEEVIRVAVESYNKHFGGGPQTHVEIMVPMLMGALRANVPGAFERCINIIKNSNSISEKATVCEALGACNTKELIHASWDFAMSNHVDRRCASIIISNLALSSNLGHLTCWSLFYKNFNAVHKKLGEMGLTSVLKSFSVLMNTEQLISESLMLSSNVKINLVKRKLADGIELGKLRVALAKREIEPLREYLSQLPKDMK